MSAKRLLTVDTNDLDKLCQQLWHLRIILSNWLLTSILLYRPYHVRTFLGTPGLSNSKGIFTYLLWQSCPLISDA